MSSPIGHSLVGFVFFTLAKRLSPAAKLSWWSLPFFIFLANLPDFDFLLIWFFHFSRATTHRSFSHSLFTGLLVGVIMAWSYQRITHRKNGMLWVLIPATLLSHGLIDMCCIDLVPPYGVQLLWPLTQAFYYTPLAFMKGAGFYTLPDVPLPLAIVRAAPGEILVMGIVYLLVELGFLMKNRLLNRASKESQT